MLSVPKAVSTSLQAISMLSEASSCSPLQGSLEVDATGNPFGFFPQTAVTASGSLPKRAGSTSVLWSTQMTRNRSKDQLEELQVVAGKCVPTSHRSPQGLGVCSAVGLDLAATACQKRAYILAETLFAR